MDNSNRTVTARRSSGRTLFQEEQKRATRAKLIAAAHAVFAQKGYAAAAVDDILKIAEVSRGAFYAHFEDKFAIFEVIFQELHSPAHALFEKLAQLGEATTDEIEDWLRQLIESARGVSNTLSAALEVAAIEPYFSQSQFALGIELIGVVGKGIPAFKLAMTNTAAGKEAMIRAVLLMMQVSAITHSIVLGQKWIDSSLAIKILAQEIHRFIHTDSKHAKAPTKKSRVAKK